MSTHADAVAGAIVGHAAHFADANNVTVTPPSGAGSAATVTATVGPEVGEVGHNQAGRFTKYTRVLKVAAADVAAFGIRYEVTIDGVDYAVEDAPTDGGGFWEVRAVRLVRNDVRRENYARER